MLTPEAKRRLVFLGVFLVPVVLVKGTSVFYGVGTPAGAAAAITEAQQTKVVAVESSTNGWTSTQRAAARRVADLYEQPFHGAPLYYDVREADAAPVQPVDPSLPNLMVQAILESSSGATALINNKTYRVGDMFEETVWKITVINNDTRSITLENQNTGKVVEAVVRIER